MSQAGSYVGTAQSRVDGRAKVTGAARYAAEFNSPGLAHGVVISSAIAKGRIKVDRRRGGARGARGPSGLHARKPAADGLVRLQVPGRRRSARLAAAAPP